LVSSASSSSVDPPPCIQPLPRTTARRNAGSLCPPTSSGIGSVGAGQILIAGMS
jgi:hypothetical protein